MMKQSIFKTALLLTPLVLGINVLLIANACSSNEKPAQIQQTPSLNAEKGPAWNVKMQELSGALNKLLPLVSDTKAFNNPTNDASIKDATSRLKKLSHQVRSLQKPTADPAYESIARMLDEDLARAVSSLATGNRDYARLTIRESIGYCIQCHTQTAGGPNFPKLELGFDPSSLSALGRGDFYAATRQFDRALEAYQMGVSDSEYAKRDIFGWERASRSALAIAVRFKQSPDEALKIASAVQKNKAAPDSIKIAAKSWTKSIKEWSKQNKAKNRESGLALAEKLINQAEERQDLSEPQDISYLRASAELHQWLSLNPQSEKPDSNRAKALLLAGRAAEATRELNFWTLHERYYELCIDSNPKSETARACFQLLSDSVVTGYTGSSGTNLPADVQQWLSRLSEKAGSRSQ
jgi:hypothetical protein